MDLSPDHPARERRDAIEARALEIAADLDRRIGPFRAEIIEHATPCWYIVRTAPGRENTAAEHLERRCVGIFPPRFVHGARMLLRSVDPTTGRVRIELIDLSDRLIFPGRVFVFVWDCWRIGAALCVSRRERYHG